MKKVIITGVTGFIGSHVAKVLLENGIIVYGVDVATPKLDAFNKYKNFHPVVADFSVYSKLHEMIQDEIDVFYHFAWGGGFTSAIKDYEIQLSNAKAAGDAACAAVNIKCKKFVYAGTYNEFEIVTGFTSDNFSPRNTCIYSSGKLVADVICRTIANTNGIEYCAALIPMPYGENNYSKQLVNVVLSQLNEGVSPKLVEGNNTYDLVYIGDIAQAFYWIGEKGKNKQKYYIGHRKLKTFKELLTAMRDCVSPNVELKFGEYKDNQQIDYSLFDLEALYRDTGYECSSNFEETMRRTALWVKENLK